MRKYFDMLIGNDGARSRLAGAVLNNTLPHAFLFVGAEGSGKLTLARELSAALNCENKTDPAHPLPCHICNNCRRIREGLFPDIHYIERSQDKMSIGVDVIEAMRDDIMLSATEANHRVYIIKEAEKITPQAQNSMLKILEEPPSGVIIILLAQEADKILTTIKSRVQTIAMSRFDDATIRDYIVLKSDKARAMNASSPESLSGIISASDGRIGKALSLLDNECAAKETAEQRELTERLTAALKQSTPFSELYTVIKDIPTGRVAFKETLEEMLSALRDLILIKYDKGVRMSFFISRERAEELSEAINTKRLFALYDLFKSTLDDNSKNANIKTQIANLAAQIKLI